jgi:protein SCO1/2
MSEVFYFRCLIVCALAGNLTSCRSPDKSCCHRVLADEPQVVTTGKFILDSDSVWQDDGGNDFRLSQLRGHPVVISMFFASCEGVCVITKNDLKAVETSLPPAVRARTLFVLVTLAPERDTPAVLKQYRVEQGLSGKRWRLLRGPVGATAALAVQLGVGYGLDSNGRFKHSSEITVLDATGRVLLQQDGIHADLEKTVRLLAASAGND